MARQRGLKFASKMQKQKPESVELVLGATGTQFFKGFYNISDSLEYVQDLKGIKAIQTYNRMRKNDGQVKLALLALTHPIINSNWTIEPPGDEEKGDKSTPKEVEAAKIISEMIFGDAFEWQLTLRQILTMMCFGFSVFEKSYKYDGDFLVPRKPLHLLPDTIVEWQTKDGDLDAIRQYINAGETKRDVWIPAKKTLLFTFDREGDDYRGQSVLRAAYKHWSMKDVFYRIQAMSIERWSLGIPKVKQTNADAKAGKEKAIEAAKNMRAHEQGYVFMPEGYDVEMLNAGSAHMVDPMPAINHHDAQILKSIMAQFLELGQTETGARSLGETLMNYSMMGLTFIADHITEVINKGLLREITWFNFGDIRPPVLRFSGLQPENMALLADVIQKVFASGAVEPDEKTEAFIRNKLGFPPKDPETTRKASPQYQPPGSSDSGQEQEVEDPEQDPKEDLPVENKHRHHRRIKAYQDSIYAPNGAEADTYIHFWRPITQEEECIALREIVGKLDDSRERIVRRTRDVRKTAIDEIMISLDVAVKSGDPLKVQKIDYSTETGKSLVDSVEPILYDLMEYGREQVAKELEIQKGTVKNAFGFSKKKASEAIQRYLKAKALQYSEITLDKMVDQARADANTAIRTGLYDAAAIRTALEGFSDNTARKSANYTVNEAFSFGRSEEAENESDEIEYAVYSAILDGGTCGPCYEMDGKEFTLDAPEYDQNTPPLYNCEGGSQCRCIWVYVLKGEKKAQA